MDCHLTWRESRLIILIIKIFYIGAKGKVIVFNPQFFNSPQLAAPAAKPAASAPASGAPAQAAPRSYQKNDVESRVQQLCQGNDVHQVVYRNANYRPGQQEHNARQPLDSVQIEFASTEARQAFISKISQLPGGTKAIQEQDYALNSGKPYVKLSPEFVATTMLQAPSATKASPTATTPAASAPIAATPPAAYRKSDVEAKAQRLCEGFDIHQTVYRNTNYRHGQDEHNAKQPLDSIQIEFASAEARQAFVGKISQLPGGIKAMQEQGYAINSGKPYVKLSPDFVATSGMSKQQASAPHGGQFSSIPDSPSQTAAGKGVQNPSGSEDPSTTFHQ